MAHKVSPKQLEVLCDLLEGSDGFSAVEIAALRELEPSQPDPPGYFRQEAASYDSGAGRFVAPRPAPGFKVAVLKHERALRVHARDRKTVLIRLGTDEMLVAAITALGIDPKILVRERANEEPVVG